MGCQGRVEKATVKGATGNGRNRGRVDEPGYKSSRVGEGGWKGWEDFDEANTGCRSCLRGVVMAVVEVEVVVVVVIVIVTKSPVGVIGTRPKPVSCNC